MGTEEEDEEDDGAAEEALSRLENIKEAQENNNGRVEDSHLIEFYRCVEAL